MGPVVYREVSVCPPGRACLGGERTGCINNTIDATFMMRKILLQSVFKWDNKSGVVHTYMKYSDPGRTFSWDSLSRIRPLTIAK